MEYQYTITLGELERAYRASNRKFLCEVVVWMFCEADIDDILEDHIVDVIKVLQQEFPEYVSSSLIEPYESIVDGYIIDPDVRSLHGRKLRTKMLEDLVNSHGGEHLLTFTITI